MSITGSAYWGWGTLETAWTSAPAGDGLWFMKGVAAFCRPKVAGGEPTAWRREMHNGTHRGRVVSRRTHRHNDDVVIELVFELLSAPRAGTRVSGRFRNARLIQRARLLTEGQVVEIDVVFRRRRDGRPYPAVIEFRPAGDSWPITIAGGVAFPDPAAGDAFEPVALCTTMNFPDSEDLLAEAHKDRVDVAPLPTLFDGVLRDLDEIVDEFPASAAGGKPRQQPPPEENQLYLEASARFAANHCWSLQTDLGEGAATNSPVNCDETFARFCRAESGLDLDRPAALSAYEFTLDLTSHQRAHAGRMVGYGGMVWSRWLTVAFGIEEDSRESLYACRRFVRAVLRLGLPASQVMCFSDGRECLTVMFPSGMAGSVPRANYANTAGHFCQLLVSRSTRSMDWDSLTTTQQGQRDDPCWHRAISTAVYRTAAVSLAPNTRRRAGGTFKVRFTVEELQCLSLAEMAAVAEVPRPFEPPPWQASPMDPLSDVWSYAAAVADSVSPVLLQHVHGQKWIHADTFEFMRFGASPSTVSDRLFRAATNLLDFGCPRPLLSALLFPAAVANGLTPDRIDRQLEGAIRFMSKERRVGTESYFTALDE
jgi:hypothetical protein